jgi:acyl dehydratase
MRYFEDLVVGETIDLGSVHVSEAESKAFARQYDQQPIHLDHEEARQSIYGGLIISGWQTVGLYNNLFVAKILLDKPSFGSPGVDEIRWLVPVRPGDTLAARCTIEACRASQSKPHLGIVTSRAEVANQHGEVVLTMRYVNFIGRRPQT